MIFRHLHYTRDIPMSEANMLIDYLSRIEEEVRDAIVALESCTTEEGPDQNELNVAREILANLKDRYEKTTPRA